MSREKPREILLHPRLGELRARRVLNCVFALQPNGPIHHHHVDDVTVESSADTTRYILKDGPPAAQHARCRIIPPLVSEF
ncbi:MAG: hypothetical protein AB7O21_20030 [Gammaproteobacteria bacterium]